MPSQNYRVFISYSRKNEDQKNRLLIHLSNLAYDGTIRKPWHDRLIEAGDNWRQELDAAMKQAEVALFLVSADFIASPVCQDEEVPTILERHRSEGVIIVPIIVGHCGWQHIPWIDPLNVLPLDGKPVMSQVPRDKAWTNVVEGLRQRLENKPPRKRPPAKRVSRSGRTKPPKLSLEELLRRLPGEPTRLFGRDEALGWLDAAYENPETGVLALHGFGGVGKSALVRHWLETRFSEMKDDAPRFLGVSFYSQGTREHAGSSDQFLVQALETFGEQNPGQKSLWDRGQRLAELVSEQPTVLVLDGVEPLQYGPGPHKMEGQLKDPGVHGLLARLSAHPGKSLCIVTTRLRLEDRDLQNASCVQQSVETLSPDAACELLKARGVHGSDEEINAAADYLDNHPLALVLAAEYLQTFADGEVSRLHEIPLVTEEVKAGRHAKSVMAAYEIALQRDGDPLDLELLAVLGLFDRPAKWEWLKALAKPPAIGGVTDHLVAASDLELWEAISRLRQWGMLADPGSLESPELDAHPLVREYFGERLRKRNEMDWREAHSRLFDYLTSSAKEFPDTLNELEPLYAAVTHGSAAGRHQEALDEVYYKRIVREGEFFSISKLGAFGADLAALGSFFDPPWQKPVPELSDEAKAFILNQAGSCLRSLGRLAEAVQPLQAGLEARISLEDWVSAATAAGNLSELYLTPGDLRQALAYAEQRLKLADKSGDSFRLMVGETKLANALSQAGRLSEAEAAFRKADRMQKDLQPEYPLLYSLPGFLYCDLLLEQGKYEEVESRAAQTLQLAKRNLWLLNIALDLLSLGRAYLLRAREGKTGDYAQAAEQLNQAVDGLRLAGDVEFLSRGLLARAELNIVKGDFIRARDDLDEALSIAVRGEMRLYEADCHLGYARLHVVQGEKEQAQESLTTARGMIERMGYHRRNKDVAEIEQQIGEMAGRADGG
ncbi:MAG TPA: tetratricopeptide repeat protein [Pyrinomonadaceae bacterium]|nr:tetratricopeptide repeat protein [Pyrinomonadaceae bacterium]